MNDICLTGIKPTGNPHLGNYFGMMRPTLELADQEEFKEILVFIANYHALNARPVPLDLRTQTRELALDLLAIGLDPERVTLFYQSDVPELTELTWIFNNLVTTSYLERSHAYKDAIANGKEANMGLFDYPVLMAADILAYDSTVVPVGRDQKQHVEIAQKICDKFNHQYGALFIRPVPLITEELGVIPGLDGRKMSKSYGNTIDLFESEESTQSKVMKIITDSKGPTEPKDPDTCTIMNYYRLVESKDQFEELAHRYREGTIAYKEAKEILATALNAFLRPFRIRRSELSAQPEYTDQILREGGAKARIKAQAKLRATRDMVGLI